MDDNVTTVWYKTSSCWRYACKMRGKRQSGSLPVLGRVDLEGLVQRPLEKADLVLVLCEKAESRALVYLRASVLTNAGSATAPTTGAMPLTGEWR